MVIMCMATFAMTAIMKGTLDNKCAENKVKHNNFALPLMLNEIVKMLKNTCARVLRPAKFAMTVNDNKRTENKVNCQILCKARENVSL